LDHLVTKTENFAGGGEKPVKKKKKGCLGNFRGKQLVEVQTWPEGMSTEK